ncbi:MBL fold metallo-hydrolase [Ferruginibacter yonginensis]|uniref:MBL fold metallo-hydrolase n=1 Tax=Ferruginibacter yonginensis TaxID=1310416 RepID=A0ABV8QRY7_9BACT
MLYFFILLAIVIIATVVFLQSPKFGSLPKGKRLATLQQLPNYKNKQFQNIHPTPDLAEDVTYWKVLKDFIFNKNKHLKPTQPIPSKKTNLHALPINDDVLVWFGHSSYFFQTDGIKFLVDPVLSGAASPLPLSVQSFAGTDVYGVHDIPNIDYLIISHDHWDHLDYKTIKALQPNINKVICGWGVGAHFEKWGYTAEQIIEKNWNEQFTLHQGFTINTVPARHFSGRGLQRNTSLWQSYALKTPTKNIFIGGDSGYDTHFKTAGEALGPFDWAILECGQYDYSWKYIHMMPHEVLQAAADLKATQLLPLHWGKFKLANHNWYDPIVTLTQLSNNTIPIATPMIGETLQLQQTPTVQKWWEPLL